MAAQVAARPRIAVLASGRGTNLQALIDAVAAGALAADLAGVFSDRATARALDRARAAGLPAAALDPRAHASRLDFDEALFAAVADAGADLVVCAGYLRLLSAPVVEAWEGRILNIHPSLLPAFKGLRTHQRALDAGVAEHGASVHYVTPDLDGGPVIAQARVPVAPGDDAATLGARVLEREHALLVAALQLVATGRARLQGDAVFVDGAALAAPLQLGAGGGLA